MKKRFHRVRRNVASALLRKANVRTREIFTHLGWAVLPPPPYSPGLATSHFHLFGALKDAVHGRKFESDDDVVCASGCGNGTRNGTKWAYMRSFHIGAKLWNCTESS